MADQSSKKISVKYSTIHYQLKNKYDLTITEYCILDSIDVLSHNRKYNGWCVTSKQSIADFIGCSRRKVQDTINKICDLGLAERSEDGSDIRSTDKYIAERNYYKNLDQKEEDDSASEIPKLIEVKDYFNEKGYASEAAESFFNYYNASVEDNARLKYWRDSRGNKVKNWKQKAQAVWFKPENKKKDEGSNMNGLYKTL